MPWQNPNGGFEYFGEGGAGHFIKNGSQCYRIRNNAINRRRIWGLEKSPYDLDLVKVASFYQKGTLRDRIYDGAHN